MFGELQKNAGQRSAIDVGIVSKRNVLNVRKFGEASGEAITDA